MKLHHSPTSPFVRKVMISAIELGLDGRIELLPSAAHPIHRDARIVAANPLGQVPTLFAEDGLVLYDSRVVCEYLDALAGGHRLFPAAGPERWRVLTEQSLADGILDAALLSRYERLVRPAEHQYDDWIAGQLDKIRCGVDKLESWVPGFAGRVDIGTITAACALGYLDFRLPDFGWRAGRPALAGWFADFGQRPSFVATVPKV